MTSRRVGTKQLLLLTVTAGLGTSRPRRANPDRRGRPIARPVPDCVTTCPLTSARSSIQRTSREGPPSRRMV